MKIFITGGSGLLGSRMAEIASEEGHDVISGYCHNLPEYGKAVRFDLEDQSSIATAIRDAKPEVIYHTAALTDVDRCEREPELAHKINVLGTKLISEAAKEVGAFLIYVSTDYVFYGNRGMYREEDPTNPVNQYGKSKLVGEKYADCVARACVIYGSRPASGKINFALWILEKLKRGEAIRIVTDQYITPTLNTNLAKMLLEAEERKMTGIYHLAGATRISRYDFACRLADAFELDRGLIMPSSMNDMNWMAKRPADSSLDISKTAKILKEGPYDLNKSFKTLKEELS
jgi:dTDP-4-dehydrorhamnose reductase